MFRKGNNKVMLLALLFQKKKKETFFFLPICSDFSSNSLDVVANMDKYFRSSEKMLLKYDLDFRQLFQITEQLPRFISIKRLIYLRVVDL